MEKDVFKVFEKCENYVVLSTIAFNTVTSMGRFSRVPHDKIITNIFNKIKEKAAVVNA